MLHKGVAWPETFTGSIVDQDHGSFVMLLVHHGANTQDTIILWFPMFHDDVIKWKHFPCYRPFVWRIHRSPVNSPHKSQWRGALMFSFIRTWINGWVNHRETGELRRHRAHYDVIVMFNWYGYAILQSKYMMYCHISFAYWTLPSNQPNKYPSYSIDTEKLALCQSMARHR